MKIDNERARGNISDETEIVNDGEFVAYAEADYGPWSVQYERASRGGKYTTGRQERITIRGPFIGDENDSEGKVTKELTMGVLSTVTEMIDSWDYLEAAEDEVFEV